MLLAPAAARADADTACAGAAEEGQRARMSGHLRIARTKFVECAAETCKPIIRKDCAQWATEVDALVPTIVVDAKDGRNDVADVTVTMDGETLVTSLDGKSIPVDPGPHRLTFMRPGRVEIAQQILVKEGVRARVLSVQFTSETPPPPPPAPSEPPRTREHGMAPWVVVTVGAAAAATGIILLVAAPPVPPNCNATTSVCARTSSTPGGVPDETNEQLNKDQDQAGSHVTLTKVGVVSLIAGVAIAGGGLLWHFLEPTGPVSGRSGGAVITF
jgi:hypothetical protein